VLGTFGKLDKGIPPESVKAFEAALKKDGKNADIKIYDDAGHAFENPNNKEGYKAADAEDAWQRTTSFLEKNLKK
jgi:carboxymethylenebutenolidase